MAEKPSALFKAAQKGDAVKLRQLLAAGSPIEVTDLDQLTPVMIAAQAGQVEAFRVLVEHGANLHAIGLCQTDLLECAAEGGNTEIIRFLLDKGLPVEGQWKSSRVPSIRRMGHITPLQMAALNGHVEAVRILLEAGADPSATFDGQTALKRAEGDIKHPIGDQAELKQQFQAIVALLKGSASQPSPAADFTSEVEKFAENARKPAYVRLRQMLEKRCGAPRAWKPQLDCGIRAAEVVRFKLARCKEQAELEKLQAAAQKAGGHLVLAEPWIPGENAALVLFPTANKFAVIAAVGTSGPNDSVRTEHVIECLASIEKDNPFTLVYCSHDFVGVAFTRAVKGAAKLAAQLVELCPECLDEECDTTAGLAAALKKQKSFLLRWD